MRAVGLRAEKNNPRVLDARRDRARLDLGARWDTPSAEHSSSGHRLSPGAVGHLGFTGTSIWIEPEKEIAISMLTNRVHPKRDNQKIRDFRPKITI